MEINILNIINSNLAINFSDGTLVYDRIKSEKPSNIIISFIGINRISTAFLNECIGRYTMENSETINKLEFKFPPEKKLFSIKVMDIINNALLGDEYDELIDNASLSL